MMLIAAAGDSISDKLGEGALEVIVERVCAGHAVAQFVAFMIVQAAFTS